MTFRVIHYGTGFTGTQALRGIIDHPDLELVGLIVHDTAKEGRDAGDLCGIDPVGVLATTDLDAALRLDADAFCYEATTHGRLKVAIEEICTILRRGVNVSTTSIGALIHPGSARPDVLARLEAAGREGGASLFSTGIDPGFFSDYLPVVLSGCFRRIESIRIFELVTYEAGGQSDEVAFDIVGFGSPLGSVPPIVDPDGLRGTWGGVVTGIAEQLGTHLDEITVHHELIGADEGFDYQGRRVEAGTVAGLRFEIAGRAKGTTRVAVEHITRARADVAPDWPRPLTKDAYRIVIEGSPRLECEFAFESERGDHLQGGFTITAMRAVNAIPAVCVARPGVLSVYDLPVITGRGLVR